MCPSLIFSWYPGPLPSDEVMVKFDTLAIEGKASPRNPKVLILNKSYSSWILLVAWRTMD